MTKFILGNSFKHQLSRRPWIGNTIWRLEALMLSGLMRLLSWVPVDTASAFGQKLGGFIGPRLEKHRVILKNLRHSFPEKSDAEIATLARAIWSSAGSVLTEFASLDKIRSGDRIKIAVAGHIEAFNQPNRPVVLVSAHLSNWEIGAAAVTRIIQPVSAPFTPPANPWLARKLQAYRETLGVELFARDESIRPMFKRIAAGQSIAFLMDQRVDSGKPVPFMGLDKPTSLVPARLGLRFQCEIIPVRVERLHGANYLVTFYPPVTPDDPDASEIDQALQVTTKINQYFEQWIREKPWEWFCAGRMWPKQRKIKSPANGK